MKFEAGRLKSGRHKILVMRDRGIRVAAILSDKDAYLGDLDTIPHRVHAAKFVNGILKPHSLVAVLQAKKKPAQLFELERQ